MANRPMAFESLLSSTRNFFCTFADATDLSTLRRTCTRFYNQIWLGIKIGPICADEDLERKTTALLPHPSTFLEDIELVVVKGRNDFLPPHLVQRLRYLRFHWGFGGRGYLTRLPEMRQLTRLNLSSSGDELQGLHTTIPNLARLDLRLGDLATAVVDLSEFSRLQQLSVGAHTQPERLHLELPCSLTKLTMDMEATLSGTDNVHTLYLQGARAYDMSPRLWPSLTHLDCEPMQTFLNDEGLELWTLIVSRPASRLVSSRPQQVTPEFDFARLREFRLRPIIANAKDPRAVLPCVQRFRSLETLELAMDTAENLSTLSCLQNTLVQFTIRTSQPEGHVDLATIGKFVRLEYLEVESTQLPRVTAHLPDLNSCAKLRHLALKRLVLLGLGQFEFPNLQSASLFLSEDTWSQRICSRLPRTLEHLELGFPAVDRVIPETCGTVPRLSRLPSDPAYPT